MQKKISGCRCCGAKGVELVPADFTEHGTAGYCVKCERDAWDRAAHRAAFWLQDNHEPGDEFA